LITSENNFEANQAGLHFTDTLSHIITSSLSGKDRDTLCRDGENKNVPVDEQACEQADRFHVFASGLYRQGSIDSDGLGKFRTESESIGALFGVGVRLTDRFHGGVALGFSNSDNSISQVNSSSTLSSFFASAYGYYQKGQIDANAIVGYATTNITTDRIIQIGTFSETATSDQDSNGFIAHLDTGYTVSYQTFDIRTSISAGYSSADREAFSETGGGLTNLNGTAQTDTLGDVALRFRAQKNYAIGGSFLTPYLGVGIQSLFGDVTPDATLSFQAGGPAFTVVGASLDRTRGLVETGARINASDNIDLFVSYDGAFAGNSREHRFGFGIAVTF